MGRMDQYKIAQLFVHPRSSAEAPHMAQERPLTRRRFGGAGRDAERGFVEAAEDELCIALLPVNGPLPRAFAAGG